MQFKKLQEWKCFLCTCRSSRARKIWPQREQGRLTVRWRRSICL
jgi:hypothetical protein